MRPRNAGFMVHKKQILEGVSAPWEPIVSPEVFFAVRDLLTDPSRRTGPGAAPRWHARYRPSTRSRRGRCRGGGTRGERNDRRRPLSPDPRLRHAAGADTGG
jgi:hypothetical protein